MGTLAFYLINNMGEIVQRETGELFYLSKRPAIAEAKRRGLSVWQGGYIFDLNFRGKREVSDHGWIVYQSKVTP